MAVMIGLLLMTILGLYTLPVSVLAVGAPYLYGTALVLGFWTIRTQVRKLCGQ